MFANTNTTAQVALIAEKEASKYLNLSLSLLRRDRSSGQHLIPVLRIAGAVRYSIKALDEFILRSLSQPTPEAPAPVEKPVVVKRGRGRPRKQASNFA
jgi:hypothetical protein